MENSLTPAFILDKDMQLLLTNGPFVSCFERYWGEAPSIGKPLNGFESTKDIAPIQTLLAKAKEALQNNKASRSSHQIPFNGTSIELNASFTPINDTIYVTFHFNPIILDQQKQDLHNIILRNIAESVICVDLLGEVTYWNQGSTKIFGYTEQEMVGSNIRKIAPEFDSDKILNNLHNNPRPYKYQWNYTHEDGRSVIIELSTDILFDANNKVAGIITTAMDITHTAKLERLILHTNNAGKIGGWEIDLNKNVPLWTDETYKIHDIEIGKPITMDEAFSYYHPDTRPMLEEVFDKLMLDGTSYAIEIKLISAKKVLKWVRVTGDTEKDSQGNPIVLGTIQDISARKRAEEQERASDLLFKNTFDHAGIGMALVDISGVLIDANPFFVDLLGFPKSDLLKKSFGDFTHPDDLDRDLGLFKQALNGEIDTYEFPKRYITATSEIIWVQLNVSMYRNVEGEALMAIAMVQDITDKLKAVNALKELNANLEERVSERTKELTESNEELETFSYMMSHDLRTPLRSALLFSDILNRKYLKDIEDKGHDIFTHLRSSLTEMDQLVNDLLEYARMRNKDLRKQKIDTKHLIDEVLTDVAKHYDTFKDCKVDISKDLPAIAGDVTLLYHVVRNIISNCFKYKKEGINVQLTISGQQKDGFVTLTIQDNGTGFSPKFAKDIFKPFERLVNRNDVQGTGVGLAIVQRVVERHNGRVWAEGEEGVGAKFFIELPIK